MEEIIYTELRTLQKNPKHNFTIFYVSHNLYNIKYSDYNYEIDTERHSIIQIDTAAAAAAASEAPIKNKKIKIKFK
jgi:hypothetical protein